MTDVGGSCRSTGAFDVEPNKKISPVNIFHIFDKPKSEEHFNYNKSISNTDTGPSIFFPLSKSTRLLLNYWCKMYWPL